MLECLLGKKYDDQIVKEIIKGEDHDGDGLLSYPEFTRIIIWINIIIEFKQKYAYKRAFNAKKIY